MDRVVFERLVGCGAIPRGLWAFYSFLRKKQVRIALNNRGVVLPDDLTSPHTRLWRQFLGHYAGQSGLRFLEIGSHQGGSALWFLDNVLTHESSRLVCVDHFFYPAPEAYFDHNLARSGQGGKVSKVKMRSNAVWRMFEDASFDVIYVDGSHRTPEALVDAVSCWLLLKEEGIIILDDYAWGQERPPEENPKLGFDLFLEVLKGRYELLHQDWQIILRKKAGHGEVG